MSIKYNKPEDVPNAVLRERLNALSDAVARGKAAIADEFTRRIPAEVDRDADIVLAEAARRILVLEEQVRTFRSGGGR
jgi:predicted DNA-binding protein